MDVLPEVCANLVGYANRAAGENPCWRGMYGFEMYGFDMYGFERKSPFNEGHHASDR